MSRWRQTAVIVPQRMVPEEAKVELGRWQSSRVKDSHLTSCPLGVYHTGEIAPVTQREWGYNYCCNLLLLLKHSMRKRNSWSSFSFIRGRQQAIKPPKEPFSCLLQESMRVMISLPPLFTATCALWRRPLVCHGLEQSLISWSDGSLRSQLCRNIKR